MYAQLTLHHILPCFFFHDTATTEIYTLSLHDALPISRAWPGSSTRKIRRRTTTLVRARLPGNRSRVWLHSRSNAGRSEEHTSELQSQFHLVCRLLLEKKKTKTTRSMRLYTQYTQRKPN